MDSRKHKRGKYKHMLIDGDDDTVDIVTFEEVKMDSSWGAKTQRIEVPLPPVNLESQVKETAHQGSENNKSSFGDHFEDFGMDMNMDTEELKTGGPTKNTVCRILLFNTATSKLTSGLSYSRMPTY
jgi:hypothetical protein